jgi:hypothetical protein
MSGQKSDDYLMDARKWVPTALFLLFTAPTATESYLAGTAPIVLGPFLIPAFSALGLAALGVSRLATRRARSGLV